MAGSHSPGAAVDAVLRYLGFGYMQWGLFFITGAVWSADAISVMIISFLGPAVRCEWGVSPEGESLLGVGMFGGMLLFSPLWGALADAHGRRPVLLASAVITGAGGLAAAAAHGYWCLLAARVVVGAGLGAAPSSFTLFMEWVPPELRNIWMVLFSVWWTAGTVAEALLAQGLLNSHGWRAMLLASCAPQVLVVALYPCMPESPQLLLEHAEVLERRAKATPALHPLPLHPHPLHPHPLHPSQQGQRAGRAGQWRRRSTSPGALGGGPGPPPPGPVRLPQAQRSAAQLLAQAAAARSRALGLLLSAAAWAGRPLPADCPLLRDLLPDTPGDCNAPHLDSPHTPHKCDLEGQGVTHAAEVLVLGAGEEVWGRRPDLLLVQGGGPAAPGDGRGQQQGSAWAVAPPGVPQDPLPAAACCQPSGLRPRPSLEIEGQAGVAPAYGGRAAAEQQAAGRGGGEGEEGEGSEEGEWRPLLQAGQGGGEGWEEAGAGEGGVRGAVRALGRVCWRPCSAAWHEASQHAARSVEALSAPSLSPLVGRLALVWLVMAAAYYGVSLMAAALHLDPAAPPPPPPPHTTPRNMMVDDLCSGPGGAVHLPPDTFTAVMVAASAELPAMMLCLMAVISWAAAAKLKNTPYTPTTTPTTPTTTTTSSTAAGRSACAARRGRQGAAPSTKPALPSHLPTPPPSCETLAAAASSPDTTTEQQQQQQLGRQGAAAPAAACLHHRSVGSQGYSRHQWLGGLGQRPWSSPPPHQPPPPCLSTAAGGGGWGGPMVRSSSAHGADCGCPLCCQAALSPAELHHSLGSSSSSSRDAEPGPPRPPARSLTSTTRSVLHVDDLCSGPGGAVHLPPNTFTAVMVAASAELPAMMLCLMAVISWAAAAKFKVTTTPTPTPTNPITTTTSTAAGCSASVARRGRRGAAPSTKPALPSHLPSPPPSCETLAAAASSPDTAQQQQLGRQGEASPAAACLHHRSAGSQGHSRHQGLGGLGQRPWSSPSPHQPPPPCLSTAAGGGGWGGPMVRSSSAHWDQGLQAGGAGQAHSWHAAVAPDPTRPSSSPPSSASPLLQPARSSAPPLPGCTASMHLAARQALPLDQGQQQPQAGGSLDPHQVLVVDAGGEQQQGGQGGRVGTTWSAAGPLPPAVSWSGPTPLTCRPPAPCPPQAPAPQPCRPGGGPGSGAPQGGQGGGGAQGQASGGWMALGIAALLHGTALMLALDAGLRAHTPDTTARHAGWFAWPDGVCLWSARLMVCAAFNLLYIFTPQLLPAQVRALGLGCASSVSRLGALGAPLLALALVERGQAVAALLAFAVMCMAAGAAMQGVAARVADRGGREG